MLNSISDLFNGMTPTVLKDSLKISKELAQELNNGIPEDEEAAQLAFAIIDNIDEDLKGVRSFKRMSLHKKAGLFASLFTLGQLLAFVNEDIDEEYEFEEDHEEEIEEEYNGDRGDDLFIEEEESKSREERKESTKNSITRNRKEKIIKFNSNQQF